MKSLLIGNIYKLKDEILAMYGINWDMNCRYQTIIRYNQFKWIEYYRYKGKHYIQKIEEQNSQKTNRRRRTPGRPTRYGKSTEKQLNICRRR